MSSLRERAASTLALAHNYVPGDDPQEWANVRDDYLRMADAVLAVIHDHIETLRMAEPLHDPMPLYKEGANDMLNAVQALLSEGAA